MNYNEREADPQAGRRCAESSGRDGVGRSEEDPGAIGLLRSILDAQGCRVNGSGMEIPEEASGKSRGI